MQGRALLLATVLGALLLARSEAGPIKPVAQPEQESEYVMVKLLFEGHDQPNFDKWHANATAMTVAKVAGVPVSYLIRLEDGKIPGAKEPAKPAQKQPAPAAVTPAAPGALPAQTPAAAAPAAAAPAPAPVATATPVAQPAPAPAAPVAAAAPTTASSVSLITSNPASSQPAAPVQNAVKTNPESGATDLEPQQTPVVSRARRPRVFVLGGRKLKAMNVNPNQALAEYAIKTNASEPWAVRDTVKRKLMASAANFGMAQGTSLKGFYNVLGENGVNYYPAMWVDGVQILSGQVAMDAPPNRFINGTTKNFQHKLYKHTDLEKPKAPTGKNATNVTIAEPSFIMAQRSTAEGTKAAPQPQRKSGLAPWMVALIAVSATAIAAAVGGTVWRCLRDRRAKRQEEDAAHSEPLSPHSVQSHTVI